MTYNVFGGTLNPAQSNPRCRMIQYRRSKTNLDFTEARDNEWQ